jgi:hypothetical protein
MNFNKVSPDLKRYKPGDVKRGLEKEQRNENQWTNEEMQKNGEFLSKNLDSAENRNDNNLNTNRTNGDSIRGINPGLNAAGNIAQSLNPEDLDKCFISLLRNKNQVNRNVSNRIASELNLSNIFKSHVNNNLSVVKIERFQIPNIIPQSIFSQQKPVQAKQDIKCMFFF